MAKKCIFSKISQLLNKKYVMLLCCFICGIFAALPYYIEELFIFTFISLFIQFYIVISQRRASKGVFSPFFAYFFGFYFSLYLFLSELYPFERFGFSENQAIFVVICACLLIPLLHTTVEAVIFLVSKFFPDNRLLPLGFASVWVVGEAILTVGNMAFPWANISVSLTGWLPYLQTASLFGKGFTTFVTVFVCCALALAAYNKDKLLSKIAVIALTANILAGYILWFIPIERDSEVTCAAVQGNVLSNEKWSFSNRQDIHDRYIRMTKEAAENGAKLIILPESAIPSTFTESGRIYKDISAITSEYNTTVILGVNYCDDDSNQYNSVVCIYPDGSVSERYDKRHLVPFGEFIPFANSLGKLFPFVGELSSDSGEYLQGDKPIVLDTEYGKIAPLVCFDSIFSSFSKEATDNGATMLAVVTNDSWFNDSAGIYTHLRHSQIRAIENRRFVLRSANTGISAFINERGQIYEETTPLEEAIIYASASNIGNRSLYSLIGDFGVYMSILVIVYLIFCYVRRMTNGKNTITSK